MGKCKGVDTGGGGCGQVQGCRHWGGGGLGDFGPPDFETL